MTELTQVITSSENKLLVLKEHAIRIANDCKNIEVTDETTEAIGTQIISQANAYLKDIDAKRKEIKDPYWNAGKKIDEIAKALMAPLEEAVNVGKNKMLKYKQEQERKRQEAIAKIEELKHKLTSYAKNTMDEINACVTENDLGVVYRTRIKNFPKEEFIAVGEEALKTTLESLVQYGKAKRQAIQNPEAKPIADNIQEQQEKVIAATVESTDIALAEVAPKSTGIRKTWAFEVVDQSKLPTNWLMPNEAAIKESMKKFIDAEKLKSGDDVIVNGVRFFQKESLTVK